MWKKIDSDKALCAVIYVITILVCITMIFPFWNIIVISLNNGNDTARGGFMLWTREFTLQNYFIVFKDKRILTAFEVSVLRTVIGTFTHVLFTSLFAYGISRNETKFKGFYMKYCVVTMYVGGGIIPLYLLIRSLHLINSFWVYIIPSLFGVWHMIIYRSFFLNLSLGIIESAKIDGAGEYVTFFKIVFPISTPVFASLGLFTAVHYWNEWFSAAIYITNNKLIPLQTLLMQIINSNTVSQLMAEAGGTAAENVSQNIVTSRSLSAATMLVATMPIILVYPFVQKHFVSGIMIGSIKE